VLSVVRVSSLVATLSPVIAASVVPPITVVATWTSSVAEIAPVPIVKLAETPASAEVTLAASPAKEIVLSFKLLVF